MRCSTGSTIARASSGSRSRISSVEPLMSANSAVTVLRSPSIASGELLSGATRTLEASPSGDKVAPAAAAPFVSGAPHLPQKSDVVGLSVLHFAQSLVSAFPHFAQKLLADGLLVPHFEQRIDAPRANQANKRFISPSSGYRPAACMKDDSNGFHCRRWGEATARLGYEDAASRLAGLNSAIFQCNILHLAFV